MKKSIIFIVIALIVGVVCYLYLPEEVVIQIGVTGESVSKLPKIPAIIIPIILTCFGSIKSYLDKSKDSKGNIIAITGIVVMIIMLLINK